MNQTWTEVAPGIRIRDDGKYGLFWCVGCKAPHGAIPLRPSGSTGPIWDWDGKTKTLKPSVLHFHTKPDQTRQTECHYNITGGRIHYHGDCSVHSLRGDHDMQPFPEGWGE